MSEALNDSSDVESWIAIFSKDLVRNIVSEAIDIAEAEELLKQAQKEYEEITLYGEGLCGFSQLNFTKKQTAIMIALEDIKASKDINDKIVKTKAILESDIDALKQLKRIALEDAEEYNKVAKASEQARETLRQLGGMDEAQRALSKQLTDIQKHADELAIGMEGALDRNVLKRDYDAINALRISISNFITVSNTSRSIKNIIDKTPNKIVIIGDTKEKISNDADRLIAQCNNEIGTSQPNELQAIGSKYANLMQAVYKRALNILAARVPAENYKEKSEFLNKSIHEFLESKIGKDGSPILEILNSRMLDYSLAMQAAEERQNAQQKSIEMMNISIEIEKAIKDTYIYSFQNMMAKDKNAFLNYIDDLMINSANGNVDRNTDLMAEAAIFVRFNLPIRIEENMETKKTPLLYKTLLSVPSTHLNHDKLTNIELYTQPESAHNYYSSSEAKISLNGVSENDVEVSYAPDNGPEIKLSYYTSTALHEVGHSVDAKLGYMKANQSKANFGQWKEGEKPDDIAKNLIKKYTLKDKYDGVVDADLLNLVQQLFQGKTPTKPSDANQPLGSLRRHWSNLQADPAWDACKNAGNKAGPWYGGADRAKTLTIDGRVYQEAYTDDWVSYAFGERATTGISDYQWRAPAEWFAEVYALHFSGKLAENHPMYQAFTTDPKLSGTSAL